MRSFLSHSFSLSISLAPRLLLLFDKFIRIDGKLVRGFRLQNYNSRSVGGWEGKGGRRERRVRKKILRKIRRLRYDKYYEWEIRGKTFNPGETFKKEIGTFYTEIACHDDANAFSKATFLIRIMILEELF